MIFKECKDNDTSCPDLEAADKCKNGLIIIDNFGGKHDPSFMHPELKCCACGKLRKGM